MTCRKLLQSAPNLMPGWYARLAKFCGFDYVTVAAKNHNGFCMWDTATTDFNVMNTPYGSGYTCASMWMRCARLICRLGMYFSPDDAHFQWRRGKTCRPALMTTPILNTTPSCWNMTKRRFANW